MKWMASTGSGVACHRAAPPATDVTTSTCDRDHVQIRQLFLLLLEGILTTLLYQPNNLGCAALRVRSSYASSALGSCLLPRCRAAFDIGPAKTQNTIYRRGRAPDFNLA
eukprot:scaffold305394_cov34-Prasinocladus_malaysianus.AAC.1